MNRGYDDDDPTEDGYKECNVCHSEYAGSCPINSSDCPFQQDDSEKEIDLTELDEVEDLVEEEEDDEDLVMFEDEFE